MPSKDFQDFVSSCFPTNFGEWHDGLNNSALLKLTGDERIEAERMILNGIRPTWRSNNAIEAAGYLRLRSASALLKREIANTRIKRFLEIVILFPLYIISYEYFHERIAKLAWSLHQIEKYPKSLSLIISELESSKWKEKTPSFFQMYGFILLTSFYEEAKTIEYLESCLHDKKFAILAKSALETVKYRKSHKV